MARTLREETRTLRGSTAYTAEVAHDPGDVACGERAYLGLVVMTEPAAGNGPQVSEVAVHGPACTAAPTPSHSTASTPDATPTPSPYLTGTPTAPPASSRHSSPTSDPP
ncbi:hypothetical protein, partial [Nonomuraea aridisoli]|uniref:hypothetical protein n=1 Tax=Nonomuraea aridisoli TaxID=2070368 RepID=UPI003F69C924